MSQKLNDQTFLLYAMKHYTNPQCSSIEDFNEEFQGIIGNLKDNSERRNQILHDLMDGKDLVSNNVSSNASNIETETMKPGDSDSNSEEMSAWERRLEGLE